MYQTFYIDIDEEIASVIDRLRRSPNTENFFVIPKRALVIQSIVNLKLIKREAEKVGKKAIIVTQDEIGKVMAEKVGIPVRTSTEGLEVQKNTGVINSNMADRKNVVSVDNAKQCGEHDINKRCRLSVVGTEDFFGGIAGNVNGINARENASVFHGGMVETKTRAARPLENRNMQQRITNVATKESQDAYKKQDVSISLPGISNKIIAMQDDSSDLRKTQRLEKIFQKSEDVSKRVTSSQIPLGKKTKNYVFIFILLCLIALGGVAGYVLIPSAKVSVFVESKKQKIDVSVTGITQENVTDNALAIPLRVIEKEENITMEYSSTGTANSNGQKARGKVLISNEYDDSPQQLVATTRLRSADGKIFRLTKDAVVPGMKTVNGEKSAGIVEVEVMADQPGGEYNIEATTFVIPGFEGGPKFEKFSAKSVDKMNGGASDGSFAKSVSQEDIAAAKKKTEGLLREKIKENLLVTLTEGEVLLDEAMEITLIKSSAQAQAGEVREMFDYAIKANVKVAVFFEKDVENIIRTEYEKQASTESVEGKIADIRMDYAGITPRFDQKSLSMKVHGEVSTVPLFDADVFKREIIGKDSQQIQQLLSEFPQIGNVNIEFKPKFISRVPQYASQVDVEVLNSEP